MWSERRKADKTALVRLHGNVYQAGAWLAGRMVELPSECYSHWTGTPLDRQRTSHLARLELGLAA